METTEHLARLVERLTADGFRAEFTGSARNTLMVRNPTAAELAETIRCNSGDDGLLSFVWSWGPAIAPVEDIELAASRIAHVLKAVDE